MTGRKCPACGASVKLENLDRHVRDVHPGQVSSIALSKEERHTLSMSQRRSGPRFRIKRSSVAIAVVLSLLVVGIVAALPYFPGTSHQQDRMAFHWHPRLSITINGQAVMIPANIGIDPSLWQDHSLDAYGMQAMPSMRMGAMAPLHTHDASGEIHLESLEVRDYTLGDFVRIWGESFDSQQVLGHTAQPGHRVWMVVDGTERAPTYGLVLRDGMVVRVICDVG